MYSYVQCLTQSELPKCTQIVHFHFMSQRKLFMIFLIIYNNKNHNAHAAITTKQIKLKVVIVQYDKLRIESERRIRRI